MHVISLRFVRPIAYVHHVLPEEKRAEQRKHFNKSNWLATSRCGHALRSVRNKSNFFSMPSPPTDVILIWPQLTRVNHTSTPIKRNKIDQKITIVDLEQSNSIFHCLLRLWSCIQLVIMSYASTPNEMMMFMMMQLRRDKWSNLAYFLFVGKWPN